MYLGDRTGNLPIKPENVKIGNHELIAGVSKVVQFGDETGAAYRTMFKLYEGTSIRYLGTLDGEKAPMVIFEILEKGKPRQWTRDLFGDIAGKPYKTFYVCFNLLRHAQFTELHITTRGIAARVFKPVVVCKLLRLN